MSDLKLGYEYRINKELMTEWGTPAKRTFPFENKTGIFFGRDGNGWPRFSHGKSESIINLKDECFELLESVD